MHVVPHHHVIVKTIMAQSALLIVNSFYHHLRDLLLAKIKRPTARVIEQPIHCKEGLPGGRARWKVAACRETAVQAPGEEDWPADGVTVRQAAFVKGHH